MASEGIFINTSQVIADHHVNARKAVVMQDALNLFDGSGWFPRSRCRLTTQIYYFIATGGVIWSLKVFSSSKTCTPRIRARYRYIMQFLIWTMIVGHCNFGHATCS